MFPIEPILALAPMLVQLSLGPGPLGMHQTLGTLLCPKTKNVVVALRLQSLLLRRLKYVPGDMTNLFAMMPNLVEFRAVDMAILRRPSVVQVASASSLTPVTETPSPQDAPLFMLSEHCPRIKTLVFTDGISGSPPMDLATLFQACPNIDSWGLSAWDISPTIFTTLLALPNVLTSLEIWHGSHLRSGVLLHSLLCLSPMLQHLRAPEYRFPVSCFDMEHQQKQREEDSHSPSRISKSRKHPRPKIWNCRNLKTLHLGFVHQAGNDNDKLAPRMMSRLEQSRLIFKYLAKVCPHLRDVYLWKDDLSIDLEGGLCFLLRLQQLETLRIRTNDMPTLTERDLCWIGSKPVVTREEVLWGTEPSPDLDRTKAEQADRRDGWKEVEASLDMHVWSKCPTWPMLESFRIECLGNHSHLDILRKYRPEVERFAGEKPFLQWDE